MALAWGPDLRLFFNDAYSIYLGSRAEGALGRPWAEVWSPQREEFEPYYRRVLEGESIRVRSRPLAHSPGQRNEAIFELHYAPVRDQGVVRGVHVLVYEVSPDADRERRRDAELANLEREFEARARELNRSRAFLDSLIENLPNMVFVKDAKNLRFVRFNRAGEDLLGLNRADLIGKGDHDFFPAEQADHFVGRDREVLAGRAIVDIPEEPIETKFGTRYLHTRKIPVLGADGMPEYLLGISEDITDKRAAEAERLRLGREEAALVEREAANRRLELLSEASVTLGTSLDYHETLGKLARLIVPSLADWCSVTVRESDGTFRRISAMHRDPSKMPLIEELHRSVPANGDPGRGTGHVIKTGVSQFVPCIPMEMLKGAAQSERHFELMRDLGSSSCMVIPIRGRELVHGAIAFMRGEPEYTEADLRMAEELGRRAGAAIDNALLYLEAQEAISSRDAFLSVASHELKTPLTTLTLQAQLRRRQLDHEKFDAFAPDKLLRMVENDARQLDRLNRLIDDMLDISRINSGRLSVTPEPVNLLQLANEVAERQSDQFSRAGSTLSVTGDDGVVGMWDKFRIEQVVTNLLSNALKYGGGKPVRVAVGEAGGVATLSVADEGIGIAPKDQERIFRQFERAVTPSEVSGLGLGLYIVRQILELHHGSIRVESIPGSGARFIVSLPL
jgi:PAS domain S-box-containing protein